MVGLKGRRVRQQSVDEGESPHRGGSWFVDVIVYDAVFADTAIKRTESHVQVPGDKRKFTINLIEISVVPDADIVIQMHNTGRYREKPQRFIYIQHLLDFLWEGLGRLVIKDIEEFKQAGVVRVVLIGLQSGGLEVVTRHDCRRKNGALRLVGGCISRD